MPLPTRQIVGWNGTEYIETDTTGGWLDLPIGDHHRASVGPEGIAAWFPGLVGFAAMSLCQCFTSNGCALSFSRISDSALSTTLIAVPSDVHC